MSFHWESLVIAAISFVILYYFLNKYAFGPLFGIMEKRQQMVQSQLETAEQNRLESEKLVAEQREAIQTARKEAFDIIELARQNSSRQADEMISLAKDEALRLKNEALKDIEDEKNKAIAQLRTQVSAMSVLIASKIIEKQIDEKSQRQLVDHYLNEVGGKV